jgi:hypothetical protein
MNIKNLAQSFIVSLLLLSGMACSVSATGEPDGALKPQNRETAHKVDGPSIAGIWKSDCNLKNDGRYETITMSIDGQSVSRKQEIFSDQNCSSSFKINQWQGLFRYITVYANNFYEVEYQIDLGQGATQFTGENIRLANSDLWISEYYVGEYSVPTLQLKKQIQGTN